ncbi:hypothetical protein ABH995_000934 [Bradyrhizobium yuanmingense]|uniref:tyrosinase family protein n=1 Tax=Bradyrhizobium yuanmingense TaxID=108015 RepID=UPI003519000B
MRDDNGRLTRRNLLRTTCQAGVAALLPVGLGSTPAFAAMPQRKNIDDLTPTELDNYKHAFKIIVQRGLASATAKDGYVWQAALHNDFERVRPDGSIGACEHRNELFFPWHRAHLAGFEALLRAADPPRTADVSLPFWDWTKPASGMRFPTAFEDRTSPLFHDGRAHAVTPLTPRIQWDADEIRIKMVQETDWLLFAGEPLAPDGSGGSYGWVEKGPHNTIHGDIGPTMGNPESASRDPIYWSFHAYIDLIWARWQRVHTSATSPQPFTTPNTKIWVEPFTPVMADTAQTATMPAGFAYGYQYDFSIDAPAVPVASAARTQRDLESVQAGPRMTTTRAVRVAGEKRRILRLRDVAVLPDTTYAIRAYVHPPAVNISTLGEQERQRYLADSATVWKGHGHAHHPTNVNFDITNAVTALGNEFTVTLISDAKPASDSQFESARASANERIAQRPLWGTLSLEER